MVTTKNVADKLAKNPLDKNGKDNPTTTADQPKADVIPITLAKSEPAKNSIEDRFYRMDILFSHREKWEKIKESLDKVNKFKLTTDGRSDSISFKDSSGNSFTTYSPDVLSKVIAMLKEDLSAKLQEVENQINL
jgi:hypothetical protein